jgi:hypothetical protein
MITALEATKHIPMAVRVEVAHTQTAVTATQFRLTVQAGQVTAQDRADIKA